MVHQKTSIGRRIRTSVRRPFMVGFGRRYDEPIRSFYCSTQSSPAHATFQNYLVAMLNGQTGWNGEHWAAERTGWLVVLQKVILNLKGEAEAAKEEEATISFCCWHPAKAESVTNIIKSESKYHERNQKWHRKNLLAVKAFTFKGKFILTRYFKGGKYSSFNYTVSFNYYLSHLSKFGTFAV